MDETSLAVAAIKPVAKKRGPYKKKVPTNSSGEPVKLPNQDAPPVVDTLPKSAPAPDTQLLEKYFMELSGTLRSSSDMSAVHYRDLSTKFATLKDDLNSMQSKVDLLHNTQEKGLTKLRKLKKRMVGNPDRPLTMEAPKSHYIEEPPKAPAVEVNNPFKRLRF